MLVSHHYLSKPAYQSIVPPSSNSYNLQLSNYRAIFLRYDFQLNSIEDIKRGFQQRKLAPDNNSAIKDAFCKYILYNPKLDSMLSILKILQKISECITENELTIFSENAIIKASSEAKTKKDSSNEFILKIVNNAICTPHKIVPRKLMGVVSLAIENLSDRYSTLRVFGIIKKHVSENDLLQITKKAIIKEYSDVDFACNMYISTLIDHHNSSKESQRILHEFNNAQKEIKQKEREILVSQQEKDSMYSAMIWILLLNLFFYSLMHGIKQEN